MVTGFRDYTSVSSALATISRLTRSRNPTETVKAQDSYGRVVAEDVVAPINVPDKQRSHMDGYAIVASSLVGVDGSILSQKITASSGNAAFDDAVLRAVTATQKLPRDTDGTLPTDVILTFNP